MLSDFSLNSMTRRFELRRDSNKFDLPTSHKCVFRSERDSIYKSSF